MNKKPHKPKTPALPPASALRPRLDALLGDAVGEADDALARLAAGIRPEQVVSTLLRAFDEAGAAAQRRWEPALLAWLTSSGHLDTLAALVESQTLDAHLEGRAQQWLAAAGVAVGTPPAPEGDFCAAYLFDDGSQATASLFWYADRRRSRVQGFNFLMDHNPPWEGAVKDIIVYPTRPWAKARAEWVDGWRRRGHALEAINPQAFKRVALAALGQNQAANIRLPEDLIAAREPFLQHVLTLPDGPDTLPFDAATFDFLAANGQSPEQLRAIEQSFGRRVRLDDGREVVVMG